MQTLTKVKDMKTTVTRYHDISFAHRAPNDPGSCSRIHGHNYRFYFTLGSAKQEDRIIDFSVIKKLLCQWLEDNWDHRLMLWEEDPIAQEYDFTKSSISLFEVLANSIVVVNFDTSVENIARAMLTKGNELLTNYTGNLDVKLIRVHVEETRKCSATAELC